MSRRMSSQDENRPPSEAFMQSMRLASNSMKSDHFSSEKSSVGWKTYTASISLFVIGLILFVTGASIYWNGGTQYSKKENKAGFDVLILGSTLLLPGTYAVCILYGSYKKWRGFNYRMLPSFD